MDVHLIKLLNLKDNRCKNQVFFQLPSKFNNNSKKVEPANKRERQQSIVD